MKEPLYVTRPLLPELSDLQTLLAEIWESKLVTNGGPMHQRLEAELQQYLGVPTAMIFNNGTIALLAALKLFDLPPGSEVITTPLTFAATAHAISWNGLKPVFVDVLPDTLTIDPEAVEKAINGNTSAVLGVHVYGTICDLSELQGICDRHHIRLLYDAAHAFGTTVDGRGIGTFGDASVFSFHATKLFNTLEGGLISTNRADDKDKIYFLRNFGIKNEDEVVSVGINGKLNEVQAAIGLLNLPLVAGERSKRSIIRQKYEASLGEIPGIKMQKRQAGVFNAEQYFPIVVDEQVLGKTRNIVYDQLKAQGIFARKYFHPICTDFEPYRGEPIHSMRNKPYVEIVKSQVLCLPFHSGVTDGDISAMQAIIVRGTA